VLVKLAGGSEGVCSVLWLAIFFTITCLPLLASACSPSLPLVARRRVGEDDGVKTVGVAVVVMPLFISTRGVKNGCLGRCGGERWVLYLLV
jgi:hypothetical protein